MSSLLMDQFIWVKVGKVTIYSNLSGILGSLRWTLVLYINKCIYIYSIYIHTHITTILSTDSAGCCESKHPKLGWFIHLSDSLFQDQPCQHRVLAAGSSRYSRCALGHRKPRLVGVGLGPPVLPFWEFLKINLANRFLPLLPPQKKMES